MTNDKTWKIVGLKEIQAAINDLPLKMQAATYRSVNRKMASKFIIKNIKGALNYSQRTLKNIKVSADPKDKTGIYAGVMSNSFYLRFLEFGTKVRKGRGRIRGHHKIERAIDSQIKNVVKFTTEKYGETIHDILKKKAKRLK